METFMAEYTRQLRASMLEHPEDYMPNVPYDVVLGRMLVAIRNRTFNKDSESFKRTCKALKIKHTYKAIQEFIINHA